MTVTENTTVYFKAIDAAGNVTETSYDVTNIEASVPEDTTPPTIENITPSTTAQASSVVITAVFADDVNLASSLYKIGDGEWTAYTESGVTVTENTTVYFKAIDAAGNVTETSYDVTNIDTEAPVITLDGDNTSPLQVSSITASTEEGVEIFYSTDNATWTKYEGAIPVTANGTYYFKAVDEAGNIGSAEYVFANIDREAPAAPTASADVTAATNGNVLVTAVFSEDSVTKEYSLDGQNWQAYTDAITFTENGTVSFRGTDAAGNISDVTNFLVENIDREAPAAPTTSAENTDETSLVTATFSDDSVTREYSLDGRNWLAYTAAILLTANETVYFRGTDAAGNVSEITSYSRPANTPDNNQDDYLYKNGKWNEASIKVSNKISGIEEVHLDEEGSIDKDDKHNMFGNDGTNKDAGDVAKIEVEDTAKLTFKIDSTAAGTFYVYEKVDKGNGKYKQVTVGKVTVKKDKTATLSTCLSDTGNYYVSMVAKSTKKGKLGYYNVNVTSYDPVLFEDSDKGSNDSSDTATNAVVGRGTKAIVLDSDPMIHNGTTFANFVGFTDDRDYAKIELESSAYMSFDLKSNGKAKFTLWKQKLSGGKLTKVTTKTLTSKGSFAGATAAKFLDTSKYVYYVSMESPDAAKGASVYYNVSVKSAVFFDPDGDKINKYVYDSKKKLNPEIDKFRTNDISVSGSKELFLDSNEIKEEGYSNFVGYNDKVDYAKFSVTGKSDVTFTINTTGAGTFAIYEDTGTKLKVLGRVEIKATEKTGTLTLSDLEAGNYYISMTAKSTKANASGSVFYNVWANATPSGSEGAALAMPETADALAMTDNLSFGSYDADALADASASSLAELDDKIGYRNLTMLA